MEPQHTSRIGCCKYFLSNLIEADNESSPLSQGKYNFCHFIIRCRSKGISFIPHKNIERHSTPYIVENPDIEGCMSLKILKHVVRNSRMMNDIKRRMSLVILRLWMTHVIGHPRIINDTERHM